MDTGADRSQTDVTHALSIIVPVRDEAESVERLFEALNRDVQTPSEVLIVYDNDDDPTLDAVRTCAVPLRFPKRLVKNTRGRGPGRAIRAGLAEAHAPAALVVMADLSDDLRSVDRMYSKLGSGNDLVVGSRYMRGGGQRGGPLLKRLMSRAAGLSLRYGAGLPTADATNAFKMYRRDMLDRLRFDDTEGFEISMELTAKAWIAGYRIVEIPTTWTDRTVGNSKFRLWRWLPRYLHWYLFILRHSFACRFRRRGP